MINQKQCSLIVTLLLVTMGIGACQPAVTSAPATTAPAPQATEALPTSAAPDTATPPTAAPIGKRFEGLTVTIIGPAGGNIEIFATLAKPWEEETGGKVELNAVPYADLQDKILTAVSSGVWTGDIYNVPSGLNGDLMGGGYVLPVPDNVKAKMQLDDMPEIYRARQLDWGGVQYGYPWDGDVHMLNYRKDLFTDATHQAKFKEKFGYDLQVPQTWAQYSNIAEYFTGWDWGIGDGKSRYGFAELPLRKGHGFHGFVSRAVAYAKHPDDPAFFFDPIAMSPRINNPGFVRALEVWVNDLAYAPPDFLNMGFVENAGAFSSGTVPFAINWADIGTITYDPKNSTVVGKVGFGQLPGSDEVWNSKTAKWDILAGGNRPAYAAFGGWINVVPTNAKNQEAAIDLVAFLASPEIMKTASLTSGSGVNPARLSTLDDIDAWVAKDGKPGFTTRKDAEGYTGAIKDILSNSNMVFQLNIPAYAQYQDALEIAVSKALAKQATPQKALDEAAAAWDSISDSVGREKQLKLYRQSIGLP